MFHIFLSSRVSSCVKATKNVSNLQFITATTSKSDLAGCTQKISGNISPCISVYSSPDPDKKKELSKEKSGRSRDGGIKKRGRGGKREESGKKETRARTDSPRTSSRTNFSITDFRSNTIKKIAKVRSTRESELLLAES